ncbi:hypothetical protein BGY98DRAFT_1041905, partial [Russula aff. rugulosa BPL654]
SDIWKNLPIKFEQIWSKFSKYSQIFSICIIWRFAWFAQISKVQFKVSSYMSIFLHIFSYIATSLNFLHICITFLQSFLVFFLIC